MHTRPLTLGADVVMHAATKVLNGHSDVVAGALAGRETDAFWERIKTIRKMQGGILGPFEAYLLMRGMRTLHVRAERQARTAHSLAQRFAAHPEVARVLYPGLPQHPGHDVAARQMEGGFGYMMSVQVKGGEAAAIATAARVELFKRATSLGGVESLIEHRASIEGAGSPCPPDLLRLSIGIELRTISSPIWTTRCGPDRREPSTPARARAPQAKWPRLAQKTSSPSLRSLKVAAPPASSEELRLGLQLRGGGPEHVEDEHPARRPGHGCRRRRHSRAR